MGVSQSVYMANASEKKIWVLIASNPEWGISDTFKNFDPLRAAAQRLKFDTENHGVGALGTFTLNTSEGKTACGGVLTPGSASSRQAIHLRSFILFLVGFKEGDSSGNQYQPGEEAHYDNLHWRRKDLRRFHQHGPRQRKGFQPSYHLQLECKFVWTAVRSISDYFEVTGGLQTARKEWVQGVARYKHIFC